MKYPREKFQTDENKFWTHEGMIGRDAPDRRNLAHSIERQDAKLTLSLLNQKL